MSNYMSLCEALRKCETEIGCQTEKFLSDECVCDILKYCVTLCKTVHLTLKKYIWSWLCKVSLVTMCHTQRLCRTVCGILRDHVTGTMGDCVLGTDHL